MSQSLGEMLQSTEQTTVAPDTAPVEQQPVTDPAQVVDPPVTEETTELKPEPEVKTDTEPLTPEAQAQAAAQAKREQDFNELRTHKTALEADLNGMRQKLGEYGGESHLQIMAPLLKQAAEIPRTDQELETWSEGMWKAVNGSLLPAQVEGLRTEAAWGYLNDPKGQQAVCKALYGEGVTPAIIREFVEQYKADPSVMDLLRPEEDAEQRAYRQAQAEKDRASQERIQQLEEQNKSRDEQFQKQVAHQTMTKAAEVGFAPRAEVKKQFGLEFHQNGHTPEISAFMQRADARYDKIATLSLMNDPELNRLWSAMEYLATQKSDQHRQKVDAYALQVQERTRAVCTQVAQDLKQDLALFSPGTTDQAKVADLKALPATLAGGGTTAPVTSGYDLSGMPDATTNPRAHSAWVAKVMEEDARRRNTPGILQAG